MSFDTALIKPNDGFATNDSSNTFYIKSPAGLCMITRGVAGSAVIIIQQIKRYSQIDP